MSAAWAGEATIRDALTTARGDEGSFDVHGIRLPAGGAPVGRAGSGVRVGFSAPRTVAVLIPLTTLHVLVGLALGVGGAALLLGTTASGGRRC